MGLTSDQDFFCFEDSCPKTRLTGSSMKVCANCRVASYCSVSCQRADWPRHKPRCKQLVAKAALDGPLLKEFALWQKDMGPSLYQMICAHALRDHADVEYIESKLILLTLRVREPRGTGNDLQIFRFQSIQLLDRSELGTITGEPTEDPVQEMREWAIKMKRCICIPSGAAWVLTEIRSSDDSKRLLLYHQPLALQIGTTNGHAPPPKVAEDMIAMMINHGLGAIGPGATPLPHEEQLTRYFMDHPEQFDAIMQQTVDFYGQAASLQEST
ncbi:hypothetical protein FB45DRAFT_1002651 [Roridomyces roridus]|uniref:MYND-type domain-containing protein n=1 Tax=Roridomyces roridus TaxID=1738132 RepID=A0AAD7FSF2_9AGAR|nr:hypothetical protein FB45DRAFT_1002651 [Roridomyces roridus]